MPRRRTKAIASVHLYGQCAPMDEIRKIADEFGLLVIEDNAQAFDASGDTFKIGELSDAVCTSFIIQKNLGTFSDGGTVYESGEGCFDYEKDGAKYIADIALWLDGIKEHPCNGEDTFKGFQLAMALLRSVVKRKIIYLPLKKGENEIEA